MGQKTKRNREIDKLVDSHKVYSLVEAIEILKTCPPVKFDQSVEIAMKMGVDPRKADQNVRGTVSLPNGTGKNIRVLVFTNGEKIDEAKNAGAEYVGNDELLQKVLGGWTEFDAVVASPDMMRDVGKLGKVLGPRGLMPSPKAGTVTTNIAKAVTDLKAGKIEFKLDRHGVIHAALGKLSFDKSMLKENVSSLLNAISRAKPPGAKGHFFKSIALSSTMGPGLKIDLKEAEA